MPTVYIDADACPVKEETYRVAARYGIRVVVVANAKLRVPATPLVELVTRPGFGAADDYIAEVASTSDVVVTADVPLAARAAAKGATSIDPKGRVTTDHNAGASLAVRDLMTELRQAGVATGGPAPMTPKDRSRFLSKLDELLSAARRRA